MGTKKRKYNRKNNSKKKKTIVGGKPPENDDVKDINTEVIIPELGIFQNFFNDDLNYYTKIINDYNKMKHDIINNLNTVSSTIDNNSDSDSSAINIKNIIENAISDINNDKNVTIADKDGNIHTIDDLKTTLTEVQFLIQNDPSIKKITFFQTLIKHKKINENYEINDIVDLGDDSDIDTYYDEDENSVKKIKEEDKNIVNILNNYYYSLNNKEEFDQRKIFTTLEKALKKNDTDTVDQLNELISKFSQIDGEEIEEIKDSTDPQLQDDIKEINTNIDQIHKKKITLNNVIQELQSKANTKISDNIKNLSDLTNKYQDMANDYIKKCQTYQDKYDKIVSMYEKVKMENRDLLNTQMETFQTIISTTNYDNVETYIKMFLISDENIGRFNKIFDDYMNEEKQEEKQENPVYSNEIEDLIGMLQSNSKHFEIVKRSSPAVSISSESNYSEIIPTQ